MTSNWGFAQWAMMAIFLLNAFVCPFLHGKERKPYNAGDVIFNIFLYVVLLQMGGFWK